MRMGEVLRASLNPECNLVITYRANVFDAQILSNGQRQLVIVRKGGNARQIQFARRPSKVNPALGRRIREPGRRRHGKVILALVAHPQALNASDARRSEEHTSALQSLMRISYPVFWLITKTSSYYVPRSDYRHAFV